MRNLRASETAPIVVAVQRRTFRPWLKAVAAVVCVAFTLTQIELGWAEIFPPPQSAARVSRLAPASKLQDGGLHQAFLAKAQGARAKKPFRLSLSTVLLAPTTIWVAAVAVLSLLKLCYPELVPSIVFQHVPYPYSAFKIVAGWTSIMLGIGLILKWVNSHRFSWGRLVGFCLAIFLSFDSYIPVKLARLQMAHASHYDWNPLGPNAARQLIKYGDSEYAHRFFQDEFLLAIRNSFTREFLWRLDERSGDPWFIYFECDRIIRLLIDCLKDADPLERSAAAHALGELGSSFSVPALEEASSDSDPFVRAEAARAISKIKAATAGQKVSFPGSLWAGIVSLAAAAAAGVSPFVSVEFGRFVPDLASFLMCGFGIYALGAAFNFFHQAFVIHRLGGSSPIAAYVPGQDGKPGKIEYDESRLSRLSLFRLYSIARHERVHRFLHEKLHVTEPLINEILAYFVQAIFLPVDFLDGMRGTSFFRSFFSPIWALLYLECWIGAFVVWKVLEEYGVFDTGRRLVLGCGMVGREVYTTPERNLLIAIPVWLGMILFIFAYGWLRTWILNRGAPFAKPPPPAKDPAPLIVPTPAKDSGPIQPPLFFPYIRMRMLGIGMMLGDALRLAEPNEAARVFEPQA